MCAPVRAWSNGLLNLFTLTCQVILRFTLNFRGLVARIVRIAVTVALDGGVTGVQTMILSSSLADTPAKLYSAMAHQVGVVHGDLNSKDLLLVPG